MLIYDPQATLLGRIAQHVERLVENEQNEMEFSRMAHDLRYPGGIMTSGDVGVDTPGPDYTPVIPGGGPEFPIHDGAFPGPGYETERV